MTAPTGVVLAGGASSRMGVDKALIEVGGRPMAVLVADALRDGGCAPVWCQGGDADGLGRFGLDVHPDAGDAGPGRAGPIRAIVTALAAADGPTAVIAACDLPGLTGGLVRTLVRASDDQGRVAVATSGGRRHMVAAWPTAALAALEDAVARGVSSYRDLLVDLGAVEVEAEPDEVHNVNRPEDVPAG